MQSQFLNASKTHSQLTKSSGTRKASDDAPQSLPRVSGDSGVLMNHQALKTRGHKSVHF